MIETKTATARKRQQDRLGNVLSALTLIGLGVYFMGTDTLPGFDALWRWWPVFAILAGLPALILPTSEANRSWGLLVSGAGLFFLLQTVGLLSWTFHQAWPLLLIAAGVLLLVRSRRRAASTTKATEDTKLSRQLLMSTETLTSKGRASLGIVFIAVGAIVTLDNVGLFRMHGFTRWWALLLIGVGIVKLRQPIQDGQRPMGIALLLVGGFFQFQALLDWGNAWPLVLVGIGVLLVWHGLFPQSSTNPTASDGSTVSDLAVMGGIKRVHRTSELRGGYMTALMGGIALDLRPSKLAASPVVLDVFVLWGGIELKVPAEWTVDVQLVPIMGGFENKAAGSGDATGPRLIVRGHAIMGGIGISN